MYVLTLMGGGGFPYIKSPELPPIVVPRTRMMRTAMSHLLDAPSARTQQMEPRAVECRVNAD